MAIKKTKRKKKPISANKHTTQQVVIQPAIHAEIDEEIIPLIQWFNALPGVTTLFCCQGDEDSDIQNGYVLFQCRSEISLTHILSKIERFNTSPKMIANCTL